MSLRVLALALALLSGPAAAAPPPPAAKATPAPKGKLVFVAATGAEDLQTLASAFRHARLAKASGHLSEVAWLAYGRSVVVLDPTDGTIPPAVREDAKAAAAAGVRLVACRNALEKHGIDPKKLAVPAEVVPSGAVELARLISEGFEVIRY